MAGQGWGLSVEQCYGVVEEPISEPARSTPKAPGTSPRREDRERSVTGVCVWSLMMWSSRGVVELS